MQFMGTNKQLVLKLGQVFFQVTLQIVVVTKLKYRHTGCNAKIDAYSMTDKL